MENNTGANMEAKIQWMMGRQQMKQGNSMMMKIYHAGPTPNENL